MSESIQQKVDRVSLTLNKSRLLARLFLTETIRTPPLLLQPHSYQDPTERENALLATIAASYQGWENWALSRSSVIDKKPHDPRTEEVAGTLNPPAVETLTWSCVLPFIPPEKRRIVEVILDPQLFQKEVALTEDIFDHPVT